MKINLKDNIFSLIVFFVFSVQKCFSDIIYESELDSLRESVKHFSKYSKNITRIPHDCTDRPTVQIDIVFRDHLNASKYYAVFGNNKYYIHIDGITRDHIPIIHRGTQPKVVDNRFLKIKEGKQPIEKYKFIGPLYLYKLPDEKDKYILIGFNQVWVGCPQPLCISPGFDGMLSLGATRLSLRSHSMHNNIILIFRGNYFWFYDFATNKPPMHPPLTDTAIRIEKHWFDHRIGNFQKRKPGVPRNMSNIYLNDSMVVPTYIDAVVPGINKYNNCLYFFKNDEFVCYDRLKLSTSLKIADHWIAPDEPLWKSVKIDTAFHIKSLIYFIAGDQLWCFGSDRVSCHSYPIKLKELHKDFPTGITSGFQHKNFLYIIKGSLYYKISVSRFPMKINGEDMSAKYLFQDLLGCDESLYKAWGFKSYDNFIEKFAKRMQTKFNSSNNNSKSTKFNPTFLIISLFVVLISSSLLLTIWYLRPIWIRKVIQILKTPFNRNESFA